MKIYLVDIQENLINAWKHQFKDCSDVLIVHDSIFTLADKCECFISPANSFGFMDGGIDLAYSDYFGWDIQNKLQKIIKDGYKGELLVGQATFVVTNHPQVKYIIAAPTMRIPLLIQGTLNAYLATKAALRLAKKIRLDSVAFPGMGTGIGKLNPETCAKQMYAAYEEIILEKPLNYLGLGAAHSKHHQLAN